MVSGLCKETMRRERWNVRQFIGRTGFVRVVDYGSGGWGHINFDDLRGNIRCQSKFSIKRLINSPCNEQVKKNSSFIAQFNTYIVKQTLQDEHIWDKSGLY